MIFGNKGAAEEIKKMTQNGWRRIPMTSGPTFHILQTSYNRLWIHK